MTFLHSKTSFEIHWLVYVWNKSSYFKIWEWRGKMKPCWIEDKTFNLSLIKWDSYKLTFKWIIDIKWSEELKILDGVYEGTYKIKDFKIFEWVKLVTQKILLTKK